MNPFWKKFLQEGRGLFTREVKPRVYLAAFGKHPGWDDHIDDIGLETESLQMAKQILYIDGIGGQIDAGEWEKLTPSQGLEGFKHLFVWKRGGAFLMGKIHSSRDGKNRTKYPMILCAQCIGLSLEWAMIHLLPILELAEAECLSVVTADEVRAIIKNATEQMRQAVGQAQEAESYFSPEPFVENLSLDNQEEALYRILYFVQNQMAGYLDGARTKDESRMRAIEMRLPGNDNAPVESLVFWERFLQAQLSKDVPFLLTLPAHETWVDVIAGEPTTREFHALRARPEVLTFISDVPYSFDEAFRSANRELVNALQLSPTEFNPSSEPASQGRRWFGQR